MQKSMLILLKQRNISTLEVRGPPGPNFLSAALWASLTSSFAPFKRSGRVILADVHLSKMHVSMMHASLIHVSLMRDAYIHDFDPDTYV